MTALRPALLAALVVGIIGLPVQALAAIPTSCSGQVDVRDQMTVTQFRAAGFSQLDQPQLKSLNVWLSRYISSHCPAQTENGALRCLTDIDVRDQMTVTEYYKAGLDKLDKQQIKALNTWLSQSARTLCQPQTGNSEKAVKPAPVPKQTPKREPVPVVTPTPTAPTHTVSTKPPDSEQNTSAASPGSAAIAAFGAPDRRTNHGLDRIDSRITGDFHGWTGNTVFRLDNGQVWVQAGPGYFRVDLKNPAVTIKKLLIGYVLFLNDYEAKEVFVRRIR